MHYNTPTQKILVQVTTYGYEKLSINFPIEINEKFQGFKFINAYIENLLISTTSNCKGYLVKL